MHGVRRLLRVTGPGAVFTVIIRIPRACFPGHALLRVGTAKRRSCPVIGTKGVQRERRCAVPDKDDDKEFEELVNKPIEEVDIELEALGVDLVAFEIRIIKAIRAAREAARKVN